MPVADFWTFCLPGCLEGVVLCSTIQPSSSDYRGQIIDWNGENTRDESEE